MLFTSFAKQKKPAAAPVPKEDMRPLTPHEVRHVTGGPMASPTLGDKPAEMRELSPEELRLVSGGPGGFAVLGNRR